MTFEEWYGEHVEYMTIADFKPWLSQAWDAAIREALADFKEHSVATTASENGVTAPEDSNPQQVGALQLAHRHDCAGSTFDCAGCEAAYWREKAKGVNQQLTTDIAERIADCLVEDHVALLAENKALREAAEKAKQEKQEPVALDEVRRIAAEYAEPNSQVDSGNLYWALCEALKYAAPVSAPEQKPVALVDANDDGYWADILPDRDVKAGQLLYAAPVSAPKQEPVAFKVHRGEVCYKSDEDDQSYGMWCPVAHDYRAPFPEGTNFYAAPVSAKMQRDCTLAAVLAEREACAKVCDELRYPNGWSPKEIDHWVHGAISCAAAIRARGDK